MTRATEAATDGDAGARIVLGKPVPDLILCYMICLQDAANGFVGAMMLTDSRVRPLHFGFVQPVRPSRMQRLLYGATLDEHVKVDVIASRLWQGCPKKPDVVFLGTPDLLPVRRLTSTPTAFLCKVPHDQNGAVNLSALRYDAGGNRGDWDAVGCVLAELETQVDLVEPFDRMREALKEAIKPGNP